MNETLKTLKERSIYSKGTFGLIIAQDKKQRIWCKLEIARFNIRKYHKMKLKTIEQKPII